METLSVLEKLVRLGDAFYFGGWYPSLAVEALRHLFLLIET
jgi:hypothetical protein